MEFGVLGPLEAWDGQRAVALRATQQRVVLAVLLLHANRAVSTDVLADALWPGEPPASAAAIIQNRVSQLRKLLGAGAVTREAAGYVLHADEDAIDARRFERLAAEGRDALAAGRVTAARAALGDALGLWRGQPLADFTYDAFAQGEIARLAELRLVALEDRIEADLAAGRAAEVVPELEQLAADHPLRERVSRLLMLALYRSGRQADALDAYRRARRALVEVGVDPGRELQALERAILNQDETIAGPAPAPKPLPAPPTPLVGRVAELRELDELLARPEVRLVTLVGPGGSGKTRLALELARSADRFVHGAVLVPLAALSDADLVPTTIARALDVPEAADRPTAEVLADALRGRELLLVLDNFEQVAAAAPTVGTLLAGAPSVTIVATSRIPLRIRGEHEYPVAPLPAADALALFAARAAAVDSEFDPEGDTSAVAAICERLDRLPLAIELAAARVKLLPPQALLERLDRGLDLLRSRGDDVPQRQRTLRDTIDWSYELLGEDDRRVFRMLAVFAGSWSLDAAGAVSTDLDVLERLETLLDNSLIRRDRRHADEPRFTMLATIREYARERLVAARDDDVELRHAEWYAAFAERAHRELIHGRRRAEGEAWLGRLERDHDNLRSALTWARDRGETELLLRLCIALRTFWHVRGHVREGARWLDVALAASAGALPALRAPILHGVNVFAGVHGDRTREKEAAAEALALYRELGDERGCAVMLRASGAAAAREGDYATAAALYGESADLFRTLGDEEALAIVVSNLGDLALKEGQYRRASELCTESLALQRRLGSTFGATLSLSNLGYAALHEERFDDARVALEEALVLAHEVGSSDMVGLALEGLAAVAAAGGDADRAGRLLGSADAIRAATGTPLEAAERLIHERTLAVLRADATAEPDLDRSLASGRALTEEEAVAFALEAQAARTA